VWTSRYDQYRTGANPKEKLLNTENVNPNTFGLLFFYTLLRNGEPGGDVYAQPLYVPNLVIPGKGLRNVLLVATMNDMVIALDADGPPPGSDGVLWSRSLGTPPTVSTILEGEICPAPCTNIRGDAGITSTPVVDLARGALFLVARTADGSGYHQWLHALDLSTGGDLPGSPAEIQASFRNRTFDPEIQNQRVGLALAGGRIIIAWGSHEDKKPYHGWVLSYRYDGRVFTQTGVFNTTPNGDTHFLCGWTANNCAHGGIWQSGRAPAVDDSGRVILFIGNGKADRANGGEDYGNSIVALDPRTLAVNDWHTASNHIEINAADLDLGGSGPMIAPGGRWIVGGGKQGVMYTWRAADFGGASGGGPVQQFFAGDSHWGCLPAGGDSPPGLICLNHAGHIMGGPVYWDRPSQDGGPMLYNWSEDSELRAYRFHPDVEPPIDETPAFRGPDILKGHPAGILTLSADGSSAKSGIVWAAAYDADSGDPSDRDHGALHYVRDGILRAYAATDLRPLWHSEMNPGRDRLGIFAKFVPPTVVNGRVYMATFSNRIAVYGLLRHPYRRPVPIGSLIPLLFHD